MSDETTVRVRIAVAVDQDGNWSSHGWGYADGSLGNDADQWAAEGLPDDAQTWRTVWVEADVPLPQPAVTVEGEVMR